MLNCQLCLAIYIFMRNFAISKLKTTILKGRRQTETTAYKYEYYRFPKFSKRVRTD